MMIIITIITISDNSSIRINNKLAWTCFNVCMQFYKHAMWSIFSNKCCKRGTISTSWWIAGPRWKMRRIRKRVYSRRPLIYVRSSFSNRTLSVPLLAAERMPSTALSLRTTGCHWMQLAVSICLQLCTLQKCAAFLLGLRTNWKVHSKLFKPGSTKI